MKKILLSFLSVVLIFCSTVSILAYADEDPEVGVIVEYNVDNPFFEFTPTANNRSGLVDLSQGSHSFSISSLEYNESYRTSTYDITKTSIKVAMQSLGNPSPHVRVTLYKSTGVSVAQKTVSLPAGSLGSGSVRLTFTNLVSSQNYYIVFTNVNEHTTSTLVCLVSQK